MRIKYGIFIVAAAAVLAAAAVFGAISGMRNTAEGHIPSEIYADFDANRANALYFLRSAQGKVEIFSSQEDRKPVSVTDIETKSLRSVDRAMLEKGIPVLDEKQLLTLLEDLGS